jgi:hypothetical protein
MVELPTDNRLKIEKIIEDKVVQGERRGYLGLSQIGKECPRALWYDFRFCSKDEYSPRIARLFQRGHREEPIIIADLKKSGVKVHSDQFEIVCGYGHIKGHIDGIGENIPDAPKTLHLLEFKTMKEGMPKTINRKPTFFHALKELGLKKSNPLYYAQCQCYMRLTKLKRTLFIAVNKNTDERYYERIRLNKKEADILIQRGEDIILSEFPPLQFKSFKCNWCNHKSICKEGGQPERNCRTCRYCDMENEGQWSCSENLKNNKKYFLSLEKQIKGCFDWRKFQI